MSLPAGTPTTVAGQSHLRATPHSRGSTGRTARPPRRARYSDEELFAALRIVAERLPPGPIIRDHFEVHASISSTTLIRRFGGWREALSAAGLGNRYSGRPVTTRMRTTRHDA